MDAQDTGDSVRGEKDRCLPQKDSRLNLGSKRRNTVKGTVPLLSESVAGGKERSNGNAEETSSLGDKAEGFSLVNSDAQRASSDESRVAQYCEQNLQNVLENGRNCKLLEVRLMTL